jgi:hypothetical protein
MISVFKKLHQYLESPYQTITVNTNYKNPKYFAITKILNHRYVHLVQELVRYNFKFSYYSSSKNEEPDPLCSGMEYCPRRWSIAESDKKQFIYTILKPKYFDSYSPEYNVCKVLVILGTHLIRYILLFLKCFTFVNRYFYGSFSLFKIYIKNYLDH